MNELKEILQTINNDQGLNKHNVINKIKGKLQQKLTYIHDEWESDQFDVNHLILPYYYVLTSVGQIDTRLLEIFKEEAETLLCVAAKYGYIQVVKNLLENGAKTDVKSGYRKRSPLHRAAEHGHTQVVEVLLEKGADVKIQDRNGQTPLHHAAERGYTQIAEALLEGGADVDVRDEEGKTPLHYAAEHGHIKTVKLLLKNGANINLQNKNRYTPLSYAWHSKYPVRYS